MSKTTEDNGLESEPASQTEEKQTAPVTSVGTEIIERLKKQKRANKTLLTKLYTRLVRLMSENTDQDSLLDCLEAFVDKKFETLDVIESLLSAYRQAGDDRNVTKTLDELVAVGTDVDRNIASVKAFVSATFRNQTTAELSVADAQPKEQQVPLETMKFRGESQKEQDKAKESCEVQVHEKALGGDVILEYRSLKENTKDKFIDSPYPTFLRKDEHSSSPGLRLPFDSKADYSETYHGIDHKIERLQIPKFNGDKTKFEYFWAAFSTIVDGSNEPSKYKMIRLKSCLEDKAAEAIARLGFSKEAYEEAKMTLKRKFGGSRRQVQNYLDELQNMPSLRERNLEDIEKFTDHLVSTIVMLKEQDRWHELKPNSMLYTLLIEKIPRSMLSNYFRWTSEHSREESLVTLCDWMVDETEYRVRAQESIQGLSTSNQRKFIDNDRKQQRTYTGVHGHGRNQVGNQRRFCESCEKFGHGVWECPKFIKELTVNQRWSLAKEKQLCFRCLGGSHFGKYCKRAKECGVNGCKQIHHKLLHGTPSSNDQRERNIQVGKRSFKDKVVPDLPSTSKADLENEAASD